MCVCVSVAYVCMGTYVCVAVCGCAHVCIFVCIYVGICLYMYACVCVPTCLGRGCVCLCGMDVAGESSHWAQVENLVTIRESAFLCGVHIIGSPKEKWGLLSRGP